MIRRIVHPFQKLSFNHTLSPIAKYYQWNTPRFLSSKDEDNTASYLDSLGYKETAVQEGMVNALKGVFGNKITVNNLKTIGSSGLEALSVSVLEQLRSQDPNTFTGTVFIEIPHHNFSFEQKMREGENFMTCVSEGAGQELLGEYLECACGGNMACSTCHIILDEESYFKLDPPCEAELDMLDFAYERTRTSRLGCQITMCKELDGMTVTIPAGAKIICGDNMRKELDGMKFLPG